MISDVLLDCNGQTLVKQHYSCIGKKTIIRDFSKPLKLKAVAALKSVYADFKFSKIPLTRPLENKTTPLLRPAFDRLKWGILVILQSSR